MKTLTAILRQAVNLFLIMVFIGGCTTEQVNTPVDAVSTATTVEEEMFTLSSSAFADNGRIADRYTYSLGKQCSGENYSPPLNWSGAPEGTVSFLLTMLDPDGGNWVHWLLVNIPAETASLEEAQQGPDTGIAGRNSFGGIGYGGPCPPSGTHRYIFTLYALDTILDAKTGVSLKDVNAQLKDHILGQCQLTGLRSAK